MEILPPPNPDVRPPAAARPSLEPTQRPLPPRPLPPAVAKQTRKPPDLQRTTSEPLHLGAAAAAAAGGGGYVSMIVTQHGRSSRLPISIHCQ